MYARCDMAGDLIAEGGRVEIRYKPNDGRAYRAGTRNLTPAGEQILPDDHCGAAEAAPKKSDAKAAKKSGGKARKKSSKPAGPAPTKPQPGEALAYCDGACSGNPGPAASGALIIDSESDGSGRHELSEYLGRGTNNIAELTAILRVAEQHKAVGDVSRPLHIYTDSSYSIGVLSKGWKAKANKELIAECKEALAALPSVHLHYVKGHAGIILNERADQLAVEARDARASRGWHFVG